MANAAVAHRLRWYGSTWDRCRCAFPVVPPASRSQPPKHLDDWRAVRPLPRKQLAQGAVAVDDEPINDDEIDDDIPWRDDIGAIRDFD